MRSADRFRRNRLPMRCRRSLLALAAATAAATLWAGHAAAQPRLHPRNPRLDFDADETT